MSSSFCLGKEMSVKPGPTSTVGKERVLRIEKKGPRGGGKKLKQRGLSIGGFCRKSFGEPRKDQGYFGKKGKEGEESICRSFITESKARSRGRGERLGFKVWLKEIS